MDRKTALIQKLKYFKKKAEIPIDKIIFFGSRAKGTARKDSDIDLVVVSKKFKNLEFRARPLLLYDYWNLHYPVDFLCYTPAEFNKMKKRITIVREAVREGKEI